MRPLHFVCLLVILLSPIAHAQSVSVPLINQTTINQTTRVASPTSSSQPDSKAQAKILDQYGKLPLSFEVNHGQTDGRVKFLSRTGGYTLFLTGDEAVLALSGSKPDTNKAKIAAYGSHFAARNRYAQSQCCVADEAPQCQSCGQGDWRG